MIGIEAYVAPESRTNTSRLWGQPHQKRRRLPSGAYLHKTIWARNNEGVHNLFRLSSRSYAEGWLVKWARLDKEIIAENSAADGLHRLSVGELQTRLGSASSTRRSRARPSGRTSLARRITSSS